jgi:hypothetical protein
MADGDGMKLDADARKRLRESLAHWERIVTDTRLREETIFAEDCALCDRFFALHCNGCPVESCRSGSPWDSVADAQELHGEDSPEFFAAAQAMLDFLRRLDAEAEDE